MMTWVEFTNWLPRIGKVGVIFSVSLAMTPVTPRVIFIMSALGVLESIATTEGFSWVMVGGMILEVAFPDFVASCTETAVTVTTTGEATDGAVRTPAEEMVPALADQLTAGLK